MILTENLKFETEINIVKNCIDSEIKIQSEKYLSETQNIYALKN